MLAKHFQEGLGLLSALVFFVSVVTGFETDTGVENVLRVIMHAVYDQGWIASGASQ